MQKIKFNNSEKIYEVFIKKLYSDTNIRRYYFEFDKKYDINETMISSGFVELNEHNFVVQGDFSDLKYIYKKENDTTYILTNTKEDVYVEPAPIPEPEPYVPTEEELQAEFESAKQNKINELSSACQYAIYTGVDVDEKHYSYTLQDQTNLENAITITTQTSMDVPYHADGESCALYTLSELKAIYMAEQINLTTHQTYFNQMKQYIVNTFTDRSMIEDLQKISYGDELTGEYLDAYNSIIEQSTLIMNTFGNA